MRKTQYFQMEFKNLEVKEEDSKIIIEGYASTPDLDTYDDIVKPEAFKDTMMEYISKYNGQVLLQHTREKIVGKVSDYRIEERGLWVRVELFNDIDGLFKSIQQGMIGAFSIGYRALSWTLDEIDDRLIRTITKLALVEISVVNGPANPKATFNLIKSIKSFFDGLNAIKSMSNGVYEIKSESQNDEIKEEDIQEVEEKEEIIENKETPEGATTDGEEEEKEVADTDTTKADDVEIDGETPSGDDTETVKSDEVKALESEIDELKETLEAKDKEIKELTDSQAEMKKTLSEKEDEIKSYLKVMPETKVETKSSNVTNSLSALRYPEFR